MSLGTSTCADTETAPSHSGAALHFQHTTSTCTLPSDPAACVLVQQGTQVMQVPKLYHVPCRAGEIPPPKTTTFVSHVGIYIPPEHSLNFSALQSSQ